MWKLHVKWGTGSTVGSKCHSQRPLQLRNRRQGWTGKGALVWPSLRLPNVSEAGKREGEGSIKGQRSISKGKWYQGIACMWIRIKLDRLRGYLMDPVSRALRTNPKCSPQIFHQVFSCIKVECLTSMFTLQTIEESHGRYSASRQWHSS